VPVALASLGVVLLLTLGGQQGRRRAQEEWRALTSRVASAQLHVSVPVPALPQGMTEAPPVRTTGPLGAANHSIRPAGLLGGNSPGPRGPIASPRLPSLTSGASSPPVVYRGPGAARTSAAGPASALLPPLPGVASITVPQPSATAAPPKRSLLTRLADFLGIGPQGGNSTVPVTTTTTLITPLAPTVSSASSPSGNAPGTASSEGCLTVEVDAGTAVVIIDGVPRGTTPYETCLGEGHHSVSVRSVSASYEPGQVAVSISKGDTTAALFHRAAITSVP
jgi:hypothetical protein